MKHLYSVTIIALLSTISTIAMGYGCKAPTDVEHLLKFSDFTQCTQQELDRSERLLQARADQVTKKLPLDRDALDAVDTALDDVRFEISTRDAVLSAPIAPEQTKNAQFKASSF